MNNTLAPAKRNLRQIISAFINARDRQYQFWERNSLSIDLWTEKIFIQKPIYINNNPIKDPWNLVMCPEDYKYSSAGFYETGIDEFGILTHYKE